MKPVNTFDLPFEDYANFRLIGGRGVMLERACNLAVFIKNTFTDNVLLHIYLIFHNGTLGLHLS